MMDLSGKCSWRRQTLSLRCGDCPLLRKVLAVVGEVQPVRCRPVAVTANRRRAFRDRSASSAILPTANWRAAEQAGPGEGGQLTSGTDSSNYRYTSTKSFNEPKQGFWGALARKAKSIIDDDIVDQQQHGQQMSDTTTRDKGHVNQKSGPAFHIHTIT
nr:uncharacterized protein LOC109162745 [Ipomoea batatas]